MLQYKRIFMFILLSIFVPALCVAIMVLVFNRFDIAATDNVFLVTSYIVSDALIFLVFWWFSKGVNKSPYLHALVVYTSSWSITTSVLVLVVGEDYISSVLAIDALISIVVVFAATKVGYKNKEVSNNVS